MKRLIVCSDGTWQKLGSPYPTNVVKLAQAIKPSSQSIPQIVFYDEGIGSGTGAGKISAAVDCVLGGLFGKGIDANIQEAYRFLCLNYEPGDEIYLFGFSRGAYTVRSLAGLIDCAGGLLTLQYIRETPFVYELYRDRTLTPQEKAAFRRLPIPFEYLENVSEIKFCRTEARKIYQERRMLESTSETEEKADLKQKQDRVQQLLKRHKLHERDDSHIQDASITLLGCWDTVGSLGIPDLIPLISEQINQKYKFHNIQLSSRVKNALHAVAIDESRHVFKVTPMERKPEDKQPLYQFWFPGTHGCVGGGSHPERGLSDRALAWMMDQIEELGLDLEFDRTVVEDRIQPNHMADFNSNQGFYRLLGVKHRNLGEFPKLDESVKERWRDRRDYRPSNLKKHAQALDWPDAL